MLSLENGTPLWVGRPEHLVHGPCGSLRLVSAVGEPSIDASSNASIKRSFSSTENTSDCVLLCMSGINEEHSGRVLVADATWNSVYVLRVVDWLQRWQVQTH